MTQNGRVSRKSSSEVKLCKRVRKKSSQLEHSSTSDLKDAAHLLFGRQTDCLAGFVTSELVLLDAWAACRALIVGAHVFCGTKQALFNVFNLFFWECLSLHKKVANFCCCC